MASGTPPRKRPRRDSPERSSSSNGASVLPPLSLSILGVEPMDEFIKEIADFVHAMIMSRPNVAGNIEVEAKIGIVREMVKGPRLWIPSMVETILVPPSLPGGLSCAFESNMTAHQHKHFNQLLNKLKTESDNSASPVSYRHSYLVDSFYTSDNRDKIRVTRDEKTGSVVECIRKMKLGDLNILSPKRAADWRVTVNLEIPEPQPIGTADFTRKKDRLSYMHEEFTIDLTQVSMNQHGHNEVLHELEIEFTRSEMLLSAAHHRNDPNVSDHERAAFDELIRAFVNNARILVRNAVDSWQ
ncbi:mRNA triphosphatase CET1, partial [Cylindrobasidium torrendii FP15055 ss-10]